MSFVVMLCHVFFNQNFQVSSDFPQVRPGSHPHNRIRLHETLHHVALSVFPLLSQCLCFLFSFLFFKLTKTGSPGDSIWSGLAVTGLWSFFFFVQLAHRLLCAGRGRNVGGMCENCLVLFKLQFRLKRSTRSNGSLICNKMFVFLSHLENRNYLRNQQFL